MLQQYSSLATAKADKYRQMLSKHFARKVTVEEGEQGSLVHFPMGICRMQVQNESLVFFCSADNQPALDAVKDIIQKHMNLLKEVRGVQLDWLNEV